MRFSTKAVNFAIAMAVGLGGGSAVAGDWYPYTVDVWPRLEMRTPRTHLGYVPLFKADKKWDLCASLPHFNGEFWHALDYGMVAEARRLGVKLRISLVGGYEGLVLQAQQMRDCVASGADAVIVAGVSYDQLDDVVKEIVEGGTPVINVANDMLAESLTAKSSVSFGERGWYLAEYLVKRHPEGSEEAKIGWLPEGGMAGWVFTQHFEDEAKHGAVEMVLNEDEDGGDPVEWLLGAAPDIKYIGGDPVNAMAATDSLFNAAKETEVMVLSYDLTDKIYEGIRNGTILAATTDSSVIQGRIAIDQAVRILEGKPYNLHVGPVHFIVDRSNISHIDREAMLAPKGFEPVLNVD